jgi:tyrosine-specific transport protein
MKPFLFATVLLMSTIVGVGIFGLPYAGAQSGFMIASVFLIILTIIITLLHLFYGEIVSRTKGKHRLVGYADYYLGRKWKSLVTVSVIVGFYGSLLVYIIVGGGFLYDIFSPALDLPPVFFNLIFFAIGAIAIYFGLRFVSGLNLLMGFFLILIIFLFFGLGFSHIDLNNLKTHNWKNIFIPYGVTLYSLAGMSIIPELREIFAGKNGRLYKKAIILGTIIPGILYFIFILTVMGLTGANTTPEAISGLAGILGKRVVLMGAIFGFLATITSFFALGLCLKETFCYDFKINKNMAWFLACFIPLILFFVGAYNFVTVITILGSLMGGIEGTAIVLIYSRAKKTGNQIPDYNLSKMTVIRYIMIMVFVLGFIYTLSEVLK